MAGWNKVYSFVIGINKFKNLSTLSCCENDALLFSEALKEKLPDTISQEYLTNGETPLPDYINLNKLLDNIKTLSLSENDIVFFFFAGHGFTMKGSDYLTCTDTSLSLIEETSLNTEKIISALNLSGAGTSILIVDACRSIVNRSVENRSFSKNTAELARRNGVITFFGCSPGEYSQELLLLGQGNGIFTFSLVESLKSGKYFTAYELDSLIHKNVEEIIQQNNLSTQRPYTVVMPLQKASLNILTNKVVSLNLGRRRKCILIVGSTNAGKTTIGQYIANQYGYMHVEMSSYAYKRYQNKPSSYIGSIQDFMEDEIWKDNSKDIIAQDLLADIPDSQDLVICGPRLPQEIETLLKQDWDITPLFLFSDSDTRYNRYKTDTNFFRYGLNYKEFIRKDMRELDWGLAKAATMSQLDILTNESNLDNLYKLISKHLKSKNAL